jgi:hypothetical protein
MVGGSRKLKKSRKLPPNPSLKVRVEAHDEGAGSFSRVASGIRSSDLLHVQEVLHGRGGCGRFRPSDRAVTRIGVSLGGEPWIAREAR